MTTVEEENFADTLIKLIIIKDDIHNRQMKYILSFGTWLVFSTCVSSIEPCHPLTRPISKNQAEGEMYINKDSNAPMMPHNVEYSQETYNRDRAKHDSERFTMKREHKHHDDYEFKPVPKGEDGTNVAMLFTNHVTTTQLIPMLEELYKAEGNELLVKAIFRRKGDYTEESKPPEETYAYFHLERELALYMGVPRFRTEPSLVNRILGFYDEYYPGSWNNKDSTTTNSYDDTIGITNWLTDPRFLFDAGSYWDDSVEYCLDANSTWIFYPYFDDKTQSCCNPPRK